MKERKQMGRVKQTLICLAATLVVGLIYFYFELPALNFHSPAFYTFIFILCAVVCVVPVILMSWLHWFCGKAGKNI